MNKRQLASIISIILSTIITAILPSLLTPIIPIDYYPLAIITTIFMAILLCLVYLLLNPTRFSTDHKKHNKSDEFSIDSSHKAIASISHINKLRIYAITTTNITALFETMTFTVRECVILLRYTTENKKYCSSNYIAEITAKIGRWKHMVDTGRIEQLTIIGYNNLPDNYFIIFDDKLLATGLIEFSSKDISGQSMSKKPTWFHNNGTTSATLQEINSYITHFDNYEKYYSQNGTTFLNKYTKNL